MRTHEPLAAFPSKAELLRDFPILGQDVSGRPLVYLDNAATTQVPEQVLEAVCEHYRRDNANVHRAVHTLAGRSTKAYEQARDGVCAFLNAPSAQCIIFTRGTTDSINTVATALERAHPKGLTVLTTALEHHSNLVPWQQAALRTGGEFLVAPLDERGDVDLKAFEELLASHAVDIVAVAHVSNVLGTVNPIRRMAELAHTHGALILIDAAQSARHETLDVQALGCDFLCLSGHKMLGPTGIGVLYGKKHLLDELAPVQFGGEMVDTVRIARTTFEPAPLRFEAGTPNYVGAIGLRAAIGYLEGFGRERVHVLEEQLMGLLEQGLKSLDGIAILGTPQERRGCLSFSVDGVHAFDIAALLDKMGVAVRSGTLCAQPLLNEAYGLESVLRASPAFYNTPEDVTAFIESLERARHMCLR